MPTDGGCTICGQTMSMRKMRGHLLGHLAEKAGGSTSATACLVRVTGYSPIRHWLYARIGPRAALRELDSLRRYTWLECCGHLSSFSTRDTSYESSMDDFDYGDKEAKTMDMGAARVISRHRTLRYVYDYGTTTELFLDMACMCPAAGIKPDRVELLARNVDIPYDCTECGGKGTAACICVNCDWDNVDTRMCAPCARDHSHTDDKDGEKTHLLSVTNSPRMGMCAYREYAG